MQLFSHERAGVLSLLVRQGDGPEAHPRFGSPFVRAELLQAPSYVSSSMSPDVSRRALPALYIDGAQPDLLLRQAYQY